jgi:hypothetical protein
VTYYLIFVRQNLVLPLASSIFHLTVNPLASATGSRSTEPVDDFLVLDDRHARRSTFMSRSDAAVLLFVFCIAGCFQTNKKPDVSNDTSGFLSL